MAIAGGCFRGWDWGGDCCCCCEGGKGDATLPLPGRGEATLGEGKPCSGEASLVCGDWPRRGKPGESWGEAWMRVPPPPCRMNWGSLVTVPSRYLGEPCSPPLPPSRPCSRPCGAQRCALQN